MGKLIDFKSSKKFEIKNKSETVAELTIYDDIGINFWTGEGVTAKNVKKTLDELPSSINELQIRINSPGGDVFDGVTIYNLIKNSKPKKKVVYIDGLAASAASFIAMAGDEIVMMEGALMMIHKASTYGYGNADDFDKISENLGIVDNQIIGIYKNKTKKEKFEIEKMMKNETWMDADQAVEEGFATSKSDEERMPISASFLPWMKNAPKFEDKKQFISNKKQELLKNINSFLNKK